MAGRAVEIEEYYVANNGNSLVPKSKPQPRKWVDKQRLDYRRYTDKKGIDKERENGEVMDIGSKKEIRRVKSHPLGMTEKNKYMCWKLSISFQIH